MQTITIIEDLNSKWVSKVLLLQPITCRNTLSCKLLYSDSDVIFNKQKYNTKLPWKQINKYNQCLLLEINNFTIVNFTLTKLY